MLKSFDELKNITSIPTIEYFSLPLREVVKTKPPIELDEKINTGFNNSSFVSLQRL